MRKDEVLRRQNARHAREPVRARRLFPVGLGVSVLFALFWISFGLFVGDLMLGKIGVMTGDTRPVLGDVGHFLLLALTAVFLTAECLRREAASRRAQEIAAEHSAPLPRD